MLLPVLSFTTSGHALSPTDPLVAFFFSITDPLVAENYRTSLLGYEENR